MKKKYIIAGAIVLALLVLFVYQRSCQKPIAPPAIDKPLPEKPYRPPVIKIPFTKDKQPIKDKALPIPAKDVDKSVHIETPTEKIDIVIGKDGKIYPAKDVPDHVKIAVIDWKESFMGLLLRPGYSYVFYGGEYHCFSLDMARVWKIRIGADIGYDFTTKKVLVGVAGRIRLAEVRIANTIKVNIRFLAGWDFLQQKKYIGLGISL